MRNRLTLILLSTITIFVNTHCKTVAMSDHDYVIVSGSQTKAIAAEAEQRVKAIEAMKGLYWDADDRALNALNQNLSLEARRLNDTYGSWPINTISKLDFKLTNVAFKRSIPENTPELREAAYADLNNTRILLYTERNQAAALAKKKTTNKSFQQLRAEIESDLSTLIKFVEHIMTGLSVFDPTLINRYQ